LSGTQVVAGLPSFDEDGGTALFELPEEKAGTFRLINGIGSGVGTLGGSTLVAPPAAPPVAVEPPPLSPLLEPPAAGPPLAPGSAAPLPATMPSCPAELAPALLVVDGLLASLLQANALNARQTQQKM
jgi:hypothetical protein